MRKTVHLLSLVLFVSLSFGAAGEVFKVDFDGNLYGTIGETEEGFESYYAEHEVVDTFGPREFTAFGVTITLEPTWAEEAANTAMQSMSRRFFSEFPYEYTGPEIALIEDWIGTDTRIVPGDPLTLTISGLPAGVYSLLSYHNDLENQAGEFEVTVTDADGTMLYSGFAITNSAATIDQVGTCAFTFVSNGVDPVSVSYHLVSGTFFLVNGFELTQESGIAAANSPDPSNNDIVDLNYVTALSWQGSADSHIASIDRYDLIFGAEPNMPDNAVYEDVTVPFDLAANGIYLDYETQYYWRIDTHVTWTDAEFTGVLQEVATGTPWTFTTLPDNKVPLVTLDADAKDILTSMEFLPAALTGLVDDYGEGDIQSATWEVIGSAAPDVAMQLITRSSETSYSNLAQITDDPNLLMDWIGTDTRDAEDKPFGDPMVLVLSGLPAGEYAWTSYHHDSEATSTGTFDATVIDANGSAETNDIVITGAVTTPVSTFETTITSNGTDDVIILFDLQPYTYEFNQAWFIMNGFELASATESLKIDFNNTGAAVMPGYQAYEADHEVAATFIARSYSAFGTSVTIQPSWGGLATVTDTTNDATSTTQSALLTTATSGAFLVRLSVFDGLNTGSETMLVTVAADACLAAQRASNWPGFNYYDTDSDCDVDLVDFNAFAVEWLDEVSLTGQLQVYPK